MMIKIWRTLQVDLQRAFCSMNFFLAVLAMFVFLIINTGKEMVFAEDVLYLYTVANFQSFAIMYVLVAALPYAASFCADWNNQFIRPLLIRISWKSYTISKVTVCALSSAAAVALGEFLYIIFFCVQYPLVDPQGNMFENSTQLSYGFLLLEGHYITYFFCHILILATAAVFFSVLALSISAYLPNVFVTMASPVIAYYFLISLSYNLGLPGWLDFNAIIKGDACMSSPLLSILYTLCCIVLSSVFLGCLFARRLKRRIGDG